MDPPSRRPNKHRYSAIQAVVEPSHPRWMWWSISPTRPTDPLVRGCAIINSPCRRIEPGAAFAARWRRVFAHETSAQESQRKPTPMWRGCSWLIILQPNWGLGTGHPVEVASRPGLVAQHVDRQAVHLLDELARHCREPFN